MTQLRLVLGIVLVLGGCGGANKQAAQEPAPTPDPIARTAGPGCKVVADHMANVLLADTEPGSREGTPLAGRLRARCESDGWSDEARSCLATMQNDQEAEGCHGMLTPEQRKALDAAVKPAEPAATSPAADTASAPPPPPPSPAPSRSRGATKKPSSSKTSDPCQGGE